MEVVSDIVYIVCTTRKEGHLPSLTDGDVVGRRFYETYKAADTALSLAERDARYSGFEPDFAIYSVHCVVQQRVTFEVPF